MARLNGVGDKELQHNDEIILTWRILFADKNDLSIIDKWRLISRLLRGFTVNKLLGRGERSSLHSWKNRCNLWLDLNFSFSCYGCYVI